MFEVRGRTAKRVCYRRLWSQAVELGLMNYRAGSSYKSVSGGRVYSCGVQMMTLAATWKIS